jgi:hypothetical protein
LRFTRAPSHKRKRFACNSGFNCRRNRGDFNAWNAVSDSRPSRLERAQIQLDSVQIQLGFAGIDRLAARANAGFVSGRYDVDGMTLYVNNGTGLWPGFALRLGRPSELTRITLRQATGKGPCRDAGWTGQGVP